MKINMPSAKLKANSRIRLLATDYRQTDSWAMSNEERKERASAFKKQSSTDRENTQKQLCKKGVVKQ